MIKVKWPDLIGNEEVLSRIVEKIKLLGVTKESKVTWLQTKREGIYFVCNQESSKDNLREREERQKERLVCLKTLKVKKTQADEERGVSLQFELVIKQSCYENYHTLCSLLDSSLRLRTKYTIT